ncbi:MAG: hypothetical protein FJY98_04240 [Candidatus Liptonbacteria bacterium]|nr:hypothetical protein [Candidatus Liptonbacteria bacterium]
MISVIREIRFAWYATIKNIQSSAELRASFLMNVVGMAINNTSFTLLWILFTQSVGNINGWAPKDIVGLVGFGTLCFGLVFSIGDGIRKLPEYVSSGSFDRFMLSPKNLLLRIATSSFNASTLGDVVFGIICLTLYGFLTDASGLQIALMFLLIIFTTLTFLGVAIAANSLSFLFVDARAVVEGTFDLFLTTSLFHGGAFQGFLRFFFILIIPALLVGTLPVEILKELSWIKLILTGALSMGWFILSIKIFEKGVRKYESANFITFGV